MKRGSTNTTLKETANNTMKDCQFPTTKNSASPNQQSKYVADFCILEGLFIMDLYLMDKQSTKFDVHVTVHRKRSER
jgi:hypothetical protein